jgi:hypothetical protein
VLTPGDVPPQALGSDATQLGAPAVPSVPPGRAWTTSKAVRRGGLAAVFVLVAAAALTPTAVGALNHGSSHTGSLPAIGPSPSVTPSSPTPTPSPSAADSQSPSASPTPSPTPKPTPTKAKSKVQPPVISPPKQAPPRTVYVTLSPTPKPKPKAKPKPKPKPKPTSAPPKVDGAACFATDIHGGFTLPDDRQVIAGGPNFTSSACNNIHIKLTSAKYSTYSRSCLETADGSNITSCSSWIKLSFPDTWDTLSRNVPGGSRWQLQMYSIGPEVVVFHYTG